MKLFYLIISIAFLQCQTKYAIYQRNTSELNEQFDINLKNGEFFYHADSSFLEYSAKGSLQLIDSVFQFEFPENAESILLSPFKKGFSELVKTNESDHIEIEIFNFDVSTRRKVSSSRHFPPELEVLSIVDSSLICKTSYPVVQLNDSLSQILLRSKNHYYFDQYILVPRKGQYQLNLFLQPVETIVSYETTTSGCYRVVDGPILYLRAGETERKVIKWLYIPGDSLIEYSLVSIEKRKLRLL